MYKYNTFKTDNAGVIVVFSKRSDSNLDKDAEVKKLPNSQDVGTEKINKKSIYELIDGKYKLSDLILPNRTIDDLLDFLSQKELGIKVFNNWGLSETHSEHKRYAVNFYGESGTGKSMAAHAVADYLGKKLIVVNYADVESKYVGETSKNICDIFRVAKCNDAIIFFDEADAVLSRRVTNMSNATDVSVNQTRSVLLMLMNDYSGGVIFATNFIENYDSAFMRRMSSHIFFELPDDGCRLRLWKKYIPKKMPTDIDYHTLVDASDGLSGSDISICILKAAFSAARKNEDAVCGKYFMNAISDVKASKLANKAKIGTTLLSQEKFVTETYVKEQLELPVDTIKSERNYD